MLTIQRYDRASLEILDRINYVAGLLETQGVQSRTVDLLPDNHGSTPSYHVAGPPGSAQESGSDDFLESLEINGQSPGVCEDILEWPVFGKAFDRGRINNLIFNPPLAPRRDAAKSLRYGYSTNPTIATRTSRGVNEEHAPSLVERFLINVHIKNPVLDPHELREKARYISETGFRWDSGSCLMVPYPCSLCG